MSKGTSKRGYHKKDMKNLNRTAFIIGGAVAALLLVIMVISFVS